MKANDIIEALEATGMSKNQIAVEADIPPPTVYRMGGRTTCLTSTLEKLEALAQRKGVKV